MATTNSPPPTVDPHAGRPGDFIIDSEAGIRVPAKDWDAYQAARSSAATPPATIPEASAAPASTRRRSGATAETTTTLEETP